MRFILLPIALFACLWVAPAGADSALTKPNNDASLRRGTIDRSGDGRGSYRRTHPRPRPAIPERKD